MSRLNVDKITGATGTSSGAPITLSGDTATLGSGVAMAANHSGVKTALNASGTAPIYALRAGVHIEYASNYSTESVTKFLNVSSVSIDTSDGTRYTVNFATALPDAAYVAVVGSGRLWASNQKNLTTLVESNEFTRTTSACQFGNVYANTGSEAARIINIAFFSE